MAENNGFELSVQLQTVTVANVKAIAPHMNRERLPGERPTRGGDSRLVCDRGGVRGFKLRDLRWNRPRCSPR